MGALALAGSWIVKFDIGQRIIATLLIVGGLYAISVASVALGGGVVPVTVWAVYMVPFALCILAGVGLWRDTGWGQRLTVAALLAQLFFVASEPFSFGLYSAAAAAVIATAPESGFLWFGNSGSLQVFLALGSDFHIAFGNEAAPFSIGLNFLPLAALVYLLRARCAARDLITGEERVLYEHRDDPPCRPARHTLAPEGHLLGTGATEAPPQRRAHAAQPRPRVAMPGGAL